MPHIVRRLWNLIRQRRLDAELVDEIEFHRAMKQQEFEARGLEPAEARFGDALAFSHAQRMWGRWFSIGGIDRTLTELLHAPELHREWIYRDLTFLVGYLACLFLARRAGVPRSWVLAGALILLLPLWSGSVTSVARFGLLVPPVYAGLARLGRNRALDWSLRATAAALLCVGSATILMRWP